MCSTPVSCLQRPPSPTSSSLQQQTWRCDAPLLIGQHGARPATPSANQTKQQAKAERPVALGQPQHHSEPPPPHLPSVPEHSHPAPAANSPPAALTFDDAPAVTPPMEVKQEIRQSYDTEEACMDTHLEGEEDEVDQCQQGGEELDISFDSQFPDLMADLITEEAPPAADPPSAAPTASHISNVFPVGVRYMVPPQPSPSSSFLPFPHPLPSSSSSRLASITDFSPEWSYPEVTYEKYFYFSQMFFCPLILEPFYVSVQQISICFISLHCTATL